MAVSSGYSLGSCNWIIHSGFEKIAYVSASSTLTTHPRFVYNFTLLPCFEHPNY